MNISKKIICVVTLMSMFSMAQAVEVGVTGSQDYANKDRQGLGLTVGEHFGAFSATAGFDTYSETSKLNKYSLVGGYDVTKIGSATLTAKAGVAKLDQRANGAVDGYAALVGAGLSIPVTTQVAATIDYRYQAGQSKVSNLDGGSVLVGAKYAF